MLINTLMIHTIVPTLQLVIIQLVVSFVLAMLAIYRGDRVVAQVKLYVNNYK